MWSRMTIGMMILMRMLILAKVQELSNTFLKVSNNEFKVNK